MRGIYTISITGFCNRTCHYCVAGCPASNKLTEGDPGSAMHSDEGWVLKQANAFDGIVAITGGEPLLHPNVEHIIRSINKDIIVYTNGDFIDKHQSLLEMKNVYWLLSTHPQYNSVEKFAKIRSKFPIGRTIVHHLAFDDIQKESTNAYVGDNHYFVSGDVRCQGNYAMYQYTPIEYTKEEFDEVVDKSKFATPDGFTFLGACDKAYDGFVANLDKSYPDTHKVKRQKDIELRGVKPRQMLNMIKTHCGKDCNSVRTCIILSKWIG